MITIDEDEPRDISAELVSEELTSDAITRAEIDVAIATARRYPRSIQSFKDDTISMACLDEETAAECFYSIRRANKTIQGPSVRLAEIGISCWGNIRAGSHILGETADGKHIRALGVCHDLEKNVHVAKEARRRITDRNGKRYSDDMIAVTANAAASVAFRNAVFAVIPRALLKGAYEQARATASGDAKTLTERRETAVDRLKALNPMITDEKILAAVDRKELEELTVENITHLIGLGTAIKDGEISVDEAFPEAVAPAVTGGDFLSAKPAAYATSAVAAADETVAKEKPKKARKKPGKIDAAGLSRLLKVAQQVWPEDAVGKLGEWFGDSPENIMAKDELDIMADLKKML